MEVPVVEKGTTSNFFGEGMPKGRSRLAWESFEAVFRRACLAKVTCNLELISKEVNTVEKPSDPVFSAFGDAAISEAREVWVEDNGLGVSPVPSTGVEDADFVALRKHIQEL